MGVREGSRIIVAGASGHAKVVADAVRAAGAYELLAFSAIRDQPAGFLGRPVVVGEQGLIRALEADEGLRVIVGIGDNTARRKVVAAVTDAGLGTRFATVIHPHAFIGSDVEVGAGTVIMAGAVINTGTRIGTHVIVNTRSSIDHDCTLEDFVSISPGATLGGTVRVGMAAAVGLGARVIHGMCIGHDSVVGAGAVVVRDIPAGVVAYGSPCRVIRPRAPSEPYL